MPIKAILTDIEGTTSAVSFVFDVLFPYAAKHLPDFVRRTPGAMTSLSNWPPCAATATRRMPTSSG
jgi:methionine salvage enolase-phosphatase E1